MHKQLQEGQGMAYQAQANFQADFDASHLAANQANLTLMKNQKTSPNLSPKKGQSQQCTIF
jgi:hypothetical protein